MCSATLGATPVKRCTAAASSTFSYALRGTPGCANTLNRVPEFPYAHDGVSIRCPRSADFTAPPSVLIALPPASAPDQNWYWSMFDASNLVGGPRVITPWLSIL